MKTHSFRLLETTCWSSCLLLLGALLALAGPAAGQTAASSKPSAKQRQADSIQVAALIKPAETIARQADFSITTHQQAQLQKAARALQRWTTIYLKPYYPKQETAVLRGFKYLVMVGRYYATAGDFGLAQDAYEQAQVIIPADSHLRAKEGKYAQELTSNEAEVDALAAQHLTSPGNYDKITIRLEMARKKITLPEQPKANTPPASSNPSDADAGIELRVKVAPASSNARVDRL